MNKLMTATAIAAAICGCIAKQPIPNGVDSLDAEDIGTMVSHVVPQIHSGVCKGRVVGTSPDVRIVAKMLPFEILGLPNDTRAKEIASELELRLREALADGGRFLFVDAGGEAAPGVTLQPDCILSGRLSCMTGENGGRSTSEFRLHLSIVDARTGIESWEGCVPLVKSCR